MKWNTEPYGHCAVFDRGCLKRMQMLTLLFLSYTLSQLPGNKNGKTAVILKSFLIIF